QTVGRGQRTERQIRERDDVNAGHFSRVIAADSAEGYGNGFITGRKREIQDIVKALGEWDFEELFCGGLLHEEGEISAGAVGRIVVGSFTTFTGTGDEDSQKRSAGGVLRVGRRIGDGE